MKTDLFQSCGHCWVFQICWHIECSTFTASSFRIWNSSAGIPSPPLAAPVKLNNTLFHKNTEAPWSSLLLLLKNRKSEAQTHQVVQVHKASLWKSWILPNNQLPVLFRDFFFFNFTLWPQFGEGNGNPLQYSCLEKPIDRGAWRATVHGITESDTTKQLVHTHTHTHKHKASALF